MKNLKIIVLTFVTILSVIFSIIMYLFVMDVKTNLEKENAKIIEQNQLLTQEVSNGTLTNGLYVNIMTERLVNFIIDGNDEKWNDQYYKILLVRHFIDLNTNLDIFNLIVEQMPNVISPQFNDSTQNFKLILINEYKIAFDNIGQSDEVNSADILKIVELKNRLVESGFPIQINDEHNFNWNQLNEAMIKFIEWK